MEGEPSFTVLFGGKILIEGKSLRYPNVKIGDITERRNSRQHFCEKCDTLPINRLAAHPRLSFGR